MATVFLPGVAEGAGRRRAADGATSTADGPEGLYAIGALSEIGLADTRPIHRAARWSVERGIAPAKPVQDERFRHEADAVKAKMSKGENTRAGLGTLLRKQGCDPQVGRHARHRWADPHGFHRT